MRLSVDKRAEKKGGDGFNGGGWVIGIDASLLKRTVLIGEI